MITNASDLNRLYAALLGGRLLRPAQFAQMTTTKDGRHMITLNFNGDWVDGGKNVVSAEFC